MTTQVSKGARAFLPAAGKDWLLPLYDPIVKLLGGDGARQMLVDQAALQPGQHVLEVGCGTGTLVLMIKRQQPEIDIVGLDPDPNALERARRKAVREGAKAQFDEGFGDRLPYADGVFDRVLSSFMFHHLPKQEKPAFLREVRRVLKAGGSFHLLDFEGANGVHSWLARKFHSSAQLDDNPHDRLLALLRQSGFERAEKVASGQRFFGQTAYYRAS